MVNFVEEVIAKQQYIRIRSNVSYVTLFVKYEGSVARVIQLIDADGEPGIGITQQQFMIFCKKARTFIAAKGYEEIEFISIVLSSSLLNSRTLAFCGENCWIIDKNSGRLVIYEEQPGDFDGMKILIEDVLSPVRENNPYMPAGATRDEDKVKSAKAIEPVIRRSAPDRFSDMITPVNSIMVVLNVLVFSVMTYFGSTEDVDYMLNHGAMFVPAVVEGGQYYRFITCMFMHFGLPHLMGNMTALLFLGDNVERAVGKIRYILIYLIGGLIGSCGSFLYAFVYNKGIVSAGASGAIFALIGALLWLVIKNRGQLENMTTFRVVLMIVYSLYSGVKSENVDMAAHLFGLIGGFVLAMCLYRGSKN